MSNKCFIIDPSITNESEKIQYVGEYYEGIESVKLRCDKDKLESKYYINGEWYFGLYHISIEGDLFFEKRSEVKNDIFGLYAENGNYLICEGKTLYIDNNLNHSKEYIEEALLDSMIFFDSETKQYVIEKMKNSDYDSEGYVEISN